MLIKILKKSKIFDNASIQIFKIQNLKIFLEKDYTIKDLIKNTI